MRYPAEQTAEKHRRLVDVASTLFRERGVAAVTVSEVMKAAGMTHGAFPSHFASKDELASAALREALEQTDQLLTEAMSDPATARAKYLETYLDPAHRQQVGRGCAFAALAVDVGRSGGADRSILSRYMHRFLERISSNFRWSRRGNQRDQAILMTTATIGALVLARAVDDQALADELLAATQRQLLAS